MGSFSVVFLPKLSRVSLFHGTDIFKLSCLRQDALGSLFLLTRDLEVLNLPAAAFAHSHGASHTTWPERNLHCVMDSAL